MMSARDRSEHAPVAVLISGRGSNMQALVRAAQARDYPAHVAVVISNRPDAPGIEWARNHGIATEVVDHTAFSGRAAFETRLHDVLCASGVEIVACAGFMRIMTAEFVQRWQGRILNIHPSLLPSFKGIDAHMQALQAGVKITGCSVHYVIPELDAGPIIAQGAVPVLPDDTPNTLAERLIKVEHQIYPLALRLVASGEALLVDGKVELKTSVNANSYLACPDGAGD